MADPRNAEKHRMMHQGNGRVSNHDLAKALVRRAATDDIRSDLASMISEAAARLDADGWLLAIAEFLPARTS